VRHARRWRRESLQQRILRSTAGTGAAAETLGGVGEGAARRGGARTSSVGYLGARAPHGRGSGLGRGDHVAIRTDVYRTRHDNGWVPTQSWVGGDPWAAQGHGGGWARSAVGCLHGCGGDIHGWRRSRILRRQTLHSPLAARS
jgi:hypothetical protein